MSGCDAYRVETARRFRGRWQSNGDLAAAAPLLAAAILVEGGSMVVRGVRLPAEGSGLIPALERMGAKLAVYHPREEDEVPVADLLAQHGTLRGIELHEDETCRLTGEIPLLALLAAQARGPSVLRGLAPLRELPGDRLAGTLRLVESFGGEAGVVGEDLHLEGGMRARGCSFDAGGDARLALAAAAMALAAIGPSMIGGVEGVHEVFPEFVSLARRCSSRALSLEKGATG